VKFLIAGLGNIGDEYSFTRHNIGFEVLDALAKASNTFFMTSKLASVAEIKHKGRTFFCIKPSTYMNLSGKAVNYYLQKEKIPIENLLVITDDIALPLGTIRIRGKGSDGGHNGLKNIQEVLNTQEYARLRFGVGNDYPKGKQVEFVLGKWNSEEVNVLNERIPLAVEAVKCFATMGLPTAMTTFNSK
jgi:peptidyl-tRNA hydrolase, PTH1 family